MAKSKKISNNKKQLQEMPMQVDNPRDARPHPSIERNLANNNTPLKKIPFPKVPQGSTASNFQELLASERYREVLDKVKTYTRQESIGEQNIATLMHQMMGAYQEVLTIERTHKTQLEQLAVELVKREMGLNDGDLEFDVKIVMPNQITNDFNREMRDTDNVQPDVDNDEDEEGEQQGGNMDRVQQIGDEQPEDEDAKIESQLYNRLKNLNLERAKRRFINAMVQGASKRGHYMYHLVSDRLRQITGSDTLLNNYSIMMSVNDLLYWMIPDEYVDATGLGPQGLAGAGQMEVTGLNNQPDQENLRGANYQPPRPHVGDNLRGMADTPAGSEEIDRNSTIPKIKARGFCFPVILHELVKGVYEVLAAHGLPEDHETAQQVIDLEDVLQKEFWDFRLGPAIWARLRNQLPAELLSDEHHQRELQNFLFAEFFKLPAKEFLVFAREVVSGSPKGARLMKELCDEVQERLNTPDDEDYDYGQSNFRRDLDSMSGDLDDDDMDDLLGSLGLQRGPRDDDE
jgi:hypothetical protein